MHEEKINLTVYMFYRRILFKNYLGGVLLFCNSYGTLSAISTSLHHPNWNRGQGEGEGIKFVIHKKMQKSSTGRLE